MKFKKSLFQIHPFQVTISSIWTTTSKATGSTGWTMRRTKTMESLEFDLMEAIVSKSSKTELVKAESEESLLTGPHKTSTSPTSFPMKLSLR